MFVQYRNILGTVRNQRRGESVQNSKPSGYQSMFLKPSRTKKEPILW